MKIKPDVKKIYLPDVVGTADLVVHPVGLPVIRVVLRIELVDGLHHIEVDKRERGLAVIREVILDSVEELALLCAEERLEMYGPERESRDVIALELGHEGLGIHPFGTEHLERKGVAHTDVEVGIGEITDNAGARIADGVLALRHLR